jgi:ComF family protein
MLFPPSAIEARVRRLQPDDFSVALAEHEACGIRIYTLTPYRDSPTRDLIWTLKYRGTPEAVSLCAAILSDAILEMVAEDAPFRSQKIVLVPMPLSRTRERERGYNQMKLVLKSAVQLLPNGFRVEMMDALVRTRHTPPQTTLSRKERLENLRGAFATRDDAHVRDTNVFLIDDVTTTGTTLSEAARALSKAGASVTAIALARA